MEPSEEVVKERRSFLLEWGVLIVIIVIFIVSVRSGIFGDSAIGMGVAVAAVFVFTTLGFMAKFRKKIKDALGVQPKSDFLTNILNYIILGILSVGIIMIWLLLLLSSKFLDIGDKALLFSFPLAVLFSLILTLSIKEKNLYLIYFGDIIEGYYPITVFKKFNFSAVLYYSRTILIAIIYGILAFFIGKWT